MSGVLPGLAVLAVCVLTLVLGVFGLRLSRRTSDFYVAGRTVTPGRNAAAIGGEYLSAASFLGVAGLVYDTGVDALWFPIGYTAGYLMLLLFVAAPLYALLRAREPGVREQEARAGGPAERAAEVAAAH